MSQIIGCTRCLVCSEQMNNCTYLNWLTVGRITAIGIPSRLYTLSMFIFGLALALQTELHGLLYYHPPARRAVGWITSFLLFARTMFPEDVYNEADLPELVEADEGEVGRMVGLISLLFFVFWALLNIIDTTRDKRINNNVPFASKCTGLVFIMVAGIITVLCRLGNGAGGGGGSSVLDWPKAQYLWELATHLFPMGWTIMSMWDTHKMETKITMSPKRCRQVSLAFIVSCCVLFIISTIVGCQHCLQCYSYQSTCQDLSWVSLARITSSGSAGRLFTLSMLCFASAFMWQTFLLGVYCNLNIHTRVLSHMVSWAVVLHVLFPQHVYKWGEFSYSNFDVNNVPEAEFESHVGGALQIAAIMLLCVWELYFTVQISMINPWSWVYMWRYIGLAVVMINIIAYCASYFSDEEIIFSWGTELYALCLVWIFLILIFASTVYETRKMKLSLYIDSPKNMGAAITIAPFGLTNVELDEADADRDVPVLNVTTDTIAQGRHMGFSQDRPDRPQAREEESTIPDWQSGAPKADDAPSGGPMPRSTNVLTNASERDSSGIPEEFQISSKADDAPSGGPMPRSTGVLTDASERDLSGIPDEFQISSGMN